MKKQFLNLGKALSKAEQKQINGGSIDIRKCGTSCPSGGVCSDGSSCVDCSDSIGGKVCPIKLPTNGLY